ncbi:hypothetical protein [Salinadaptatus halalkaliphilus]|nr:hypothetical protein [Salinadaptatus halalkaliphilus]
MGPDTDPGASDDTGDEPTTIDEDGETESWRPTGGSAVDARAGA